MNRTIVGIDLGKNVGIAIIDLNGNILLLKTYKNLRRGEIIRIIRKKGKPLILASDVVPIPSSLKKIAANLGCSVLRMRRSLRLEEKSKLTKKFSEILKNKHERDALAACIKALKRYSGLLAKIKEKVKVDEVDERVGKIFELLLTKRVENLREALRFVK